MPSIEIQASAVSDLRCKQLQLGHAVVQKDPMSALAVILCVKHRMTHPWAATVANRAVRTLGAQGFLFLRPGDEVRHF